MPTQVTQRYKGYPLEITEFGVDVRKPGSLEYLALKVTLDRAVDVVNEHIDARAKMP